MNNPFDEVSAAVDQAAALEYACNQNASRMARLLVGRLRHVSEWHLKALKRELRDFNIHTGTWK